MQHSEGAVVLEPIDLEEGLLLQDAANDVGSTFLQYSFYFILYLHTTRIETQEYLVGASGERLVLRLCIPARLRRRCVRYQLHASEIEVEEQESRSSNLMDERDNALHNSIKL
jgi:hypothetical protein